MDQRIYLIQADPINFSIDKIYSLLWSTISKTKQYYSCHNIFICPHTVQIELNPQINEIFYQPRNCELCPKNVFVSLPQRDQLKYMICGILYFLLEGGNNLQQYYQSQEFFFFKNIYGYYNENSYFMRSICQILTRLDFNQKQSILNNMPQSSRPVVEQYLFENYCVIIISPCLGAPQFRKTESSSAYYLISFEKFLLELRDIQINIGMNNPLPPPCPHNVFISKGYQNYCRFFINIYQTNPICRCQNRQMGKILYILLTGKELISYNQQENDEILDNNTIEFLQSLINEYEFNSAQEQFEQYQKIIQKIAEFKSTMSIIVGESIEPSFYANALANNLSQIQINQLWEYYKILFLQEMIELLENRVLSQPIHLDILLPFIFQFKYQQIQRIQAFPQFQESNLLQTILQSYYEQLQNQHNQLPQLYQIINNTNYFPHLFLVRYELFQHFSEVLEFHDQNNQQFRLRFNGDLNRQNIINFENQLKDGQIQL
ncbi:unnamed protein product [Paramecium primaurelia]|uniref:Uncharacterized protein n=1 Tax=Paramecium primaurelia TaxID=5886 RepID=A0A8S1LCI3_PARPR|nr:unnamed protein product [Paramecium primaurelia]